MVHNRQAEPGIQPELRINVDQLSGPRPDLVGTVDEDTAVRNLFERQVAMNAFLRGGDPIGAADVAFSQGDPFEIAARRGGIPRLVMPGPAATPPPPEDAGGIGLLGLAALVAGAVLLAGVVR